MVVVKGFDKIKAARGRRCSIGAGDVSKTMIDQSAQAACRLGIPLSVRVSRRGSASQSTSKATLEWRSHSRRRSAHEGFAVVLGGGQMLPDFEKNAERHVAAGDAEDLQNEVPEGLSCHRGSGRSEGLSLRSRLGTAWQSRCCRKSTMPSSLKGFNGIAEGGERAGS